MSTLHHIQRLDGTPPPVGNGSLGWRVRWYDGEGKRRVRTFADRKHGGSRAALEAATAFRDAALAEAELLREQRIRAHFVPALSPREQRQLRARMVDVDCRGYNRHFRVRVLTGEPEPRQAYFPFRRYGSAKLAFKAALRFRDRIEQLPLTQRKKALV